MKLLNQINQKSYKASEGFIKNYQKLIKNVVIPYQYSVLEDSNKENSEKSHVIKNFINAGKVLRGESADDGFYGMVFQDSDAAKWLEAVGFALSNFPDKELEKTADHLIDLIGEAQDKDGYLDTYFTIKDQDKRWTNLCEGHELYCDGHMMEAAVAYYESTGKRKLLDIMLKNVDCIYKKFMKGSDFDKASFPGHPEVELALMKMYRATGEKKCLELAKHFIDVRGLDSTHYEKERLMRDWTVWGTDGKNPAYNQADEPVRQQKDAKGHAVRAVYLYTAMADIASETDDKELQDACVRLWNSITKRQMYITGGIGSTVHGEAFSVDYDLPSDTAYCETCASIGLIFFASRMLEMEVKGEYSDIMEKAFYNTVLAGMQADGKKFFYVNPLEVIPGIAGIAPTHRHDLPQRPSWYACACCPPNVARLISSFGKYAYGENKDTVFCHLYASGKISFENGSRIQCTSKYPYGFTVKYTVEKAAKNMKLAIRMPDWSKNTIILKNNLPWLINNQDKVKKGYVYIPVEEGDTILMRLDRSPYFVYPSSRIPDLSGQVAVCRGPLVYCAEGQDNKEDILGLSINSRRKPMPGPDNSLIVKGFLAEQREELYSSKKPEESMVNIKMVPYYTWGNRGLNQMKIWFPCK